MKDTRQRNSCSLGLRSLGARQTPSEVLYDSIILLNLNYSPRDRKETAMSHEASKARTKSLLLGTDRPRSGSCSHLALGKTENAHSPEARLEEEALMPFPPVLPSTLI